MECQRRFRDEESKCTGVSSDACLRRRAAKTDTAAASWGLDVRVEALTHGSPIDRKVRRRRVAANVMLSSAVVV